MAADPSPTPLGRSLLLADGDLPIASGDFTIIAGQVNFLQGMQVMVGTPFSSDVFNVTYGFDVLAALASGNPPTIVKEFIKLNLVKSITTDNRVRDISDIAFDDETHFYELSPTSDPDANALIRRTSRQWQAIVVINTVSGDAAHLTLQGLGL
jgi:hypothetical protein